MEFAQRHLSTRRGSTMLGIAAAIVAGILLLVYLNQYRDSVSGSAKPVQVLVAKSLIPKGTPGDVIGSSGLFQVTSIPKGQLRDGALTDASSLHGKVATEDIFPGQQMTTANFVSTSSDTVATKLTGNLRAISVPVDKAHGLIGNIQAGDRVDVFAGFTVDRGGLGSIPVIKTLMQNALVLDAPSSANTGVGGGATTVVLRANAQQAAQLAWAADNGKVWVALRPSINAAATAPSLVTAQTMLLGVKPVAANAAVQRAGGKP